VTRHGVTDDLARALDEAGAAGRTVAFWWRDDDLETETAALAPFLDAVGGAGIDPARAAVPGGLDEGAVARVRTMPCARLLPHGWRHANHGGAEAKKSEYGPERPVEIRLDEIRRSWARLSTLAGDRALPIFVPPWNRVAADLADRLGETGLMALSTYRGRPGSDDGRLDTHVDLIDWRNGRRPLAAAQVVDLIVQRMAWVAGPIGLLSHHLVTPGAAWADWAPVWSLIAEHPAARWVSPEQALCMVAGDGADISDTEEDATCR